MRKSSNPKNDQNFNLDLIFKLEKEGKNVKEIANILDINPKSLLYRLNKLNIKLITSRSRIFKNHNYFDLIDTENKAYFLGYLLADGNIQEKRNSKGEKVNRLTLNVAESDLEIIQHLQKEILYNDNVCIRKSEHKQNQCIFRVTSNYLIDKLINKYNIKPNKTLDVFFKFPFETIPEHLQRHFIRGFFDGDGCISKYNKSQTKRLSFCSTSKNFLLQIIEIFNKNIPELKFTIEEKKGKTVNMFITNTSLGFNKIDLLFNYFYKHSNLFLTRKYIKFKKQNTVLSSEIAKGSETV